MFNAQCSITIILSAGDNLVLKLLGHIVEVVGIAGHTNQQVAVFVRMLLGIVERRRIDDIELDVMATKLKICTYERGQLLLVFLTLQQGWYEADIQQRAATLRLIQLT